MIYEKKFYKVFVIKQVLFEGIRKKSIHQLSETQTKIFFIIIYQNF